MNKHAALVTTLVLNDPTIPPFQLLNKIKCPTNITNTLSIAAGANGESISNILPRTELGSLINVCHVVVKLK